MTASPPTGEALEAARLERERALAAEMFPAEWAAALQEPGKRGNNRRARLRRRAVEEMALRPLRAIGASCGSCEHRRASRGRGGTTHICEMHSAGGVFAVVSKSDLCTDWTAAASPLPALAALLSASRASVGDR